MRNTIRPVLASASMVLLIGSIVHAQDSGGGARPSELRLVSSIASPARVREVGKSLAVVDVALRSSRSPRVDPLAKTFRDRLDTTALARGRSRKKATIVGAAIGAIVGVGAGAYASQATGGDTDPWGVPGFAAIGAGVGALSGFVISLF